MIPRFIGNALAVSDFIEASARERDMRERQEGLFDPVFGRFWVHGHWYFEHLHRTHVIEVAKGIWGESIKPSYCGVSLYCTDWSICPPHFDRPQCKYSIDLCLRQDDVWPLYVDGQAYDLEPNQALAYSGTDNFHWRDRVRAGNRVTMAFFHFVDNDFQGDLN